MFSSVIILWIHSVSYLSLKLAAESIRRNVRLMLCFVSYFLCSQMFVSHG